MWGTFQLASLCQTFHVLHPFLRRAEEKNTIGTQILFLFVVRPSSCDAIGARYQTRMRVVAILMVLLMGFLPAFIWPGVFLVYGMELELWMAQTLLTVALAVGNAAKIVFFGSIGSHIADRLLATTHLGHLTAGLLTLAIFILAQKILEQWVRRKVM